MKKHHHFTTTDTIKNKRSDTKGKVISIELSSKNQRLLKRLMFFFTALLPHYPSRNSTDLVPYRYANTTRKRYHNTHTIENPTTRYDINKRSDTKGKVFSPLLSSAQKSEVNEKVYGLRHRASPALSLTQLRSTNLAPYRHANATRKCYHNTHTIEKYYGNDRV